jgi:hypothetical protein
MFITTRTLVTEWLNIWQVSGELARRRLKLNISREREGSVSCRLLRLCGLLIVDN